MSTYFYYFDSAGSTGRGPAHRKERISKSLFSEPWGSMWWQTSCQKERSCEEIFLGLFRVCFCKQDDVNVSLEKEPARRSQFCLVIYGDPLLLFRQVFLPQLFNDCAASHAPVQYKVCLRALHNTRCEEVLLKGFPVSASSLAPRAMWNSLKHLFSMHTLKPNYSRFLHWRSSEDFQRPWQKPLSFLSLFLSLPFDVSSLFQPILDSKCNRITHSFLWKAPFLMIWQPVDTEAFQKKFQSLFPQLPQAPVINDTSHSVTGKEHRRGTSVMDGSPEQEINFFFFLKKKTPKRADQDIVRVLLQRPRQRDKVKERMKKFSLGGKKRV